MRIQLSASMSCADPLLYRSVVAELDQAGIDSYHFDFCDGHFAPTFLLSPGLLRRLRPLTARRFDVHLYCTHPSRYINELADCGADLVVVHVEADEDCRQLVHQIRAAGLQAGLGILPGSTVPVDLVELLPEVRLVIANTVGPAYAGQPFDARGLVNARALSNLARVHKPDLEIGADGNVGRARLAEMLAAGCNYLVCGTSSVFKSDCQLGEALANFRAEIEAGQINLAQQAS